MSRLTQDVGRLEDFIAYGLQDMVGDILMLFFMFSVMIYYNWQLTLLSMIPIPLIIVFTVYFGKKVKKIYHIVWKQIAGISTILASVIPGVKVVKAFGREEYENGRFVKQSQRVLETGLRSARWESIYGPTMGFITFSGSIILWFAGGRQLLNGDLTPGELIMFMGYMMQLLGPVRMLSGLNRRFLRAATSAERVFEILDTPPDIADSKNSVRLEHVSGEVEFRNVSFSYDDEQEALNDVSFIVQPGEMIGLAGHSGAGKSTLISLITRFYDPTGGDIFLDGKNLNDIQLDSLRDRIGVVLQDPFLFNGTVAENIGYSKLDAAKTEIVAAAKVANAHEFIVNFPDGYDTIVGERGARVSGGERQRISIARAILKNPQILILDEATSSIDTETESKIQEALERLIRGRTVFAIAHRLSTLKYSNRLLILTDGKVEEIGTHEELVAKDGTYASLCQKQTDLSRIRAL
jgi:ATP-binding cassette subfamily B protein